MSRPRGPLEPKTVNVDAIAVPKGIDKINYTLNACIDHDSRIAELEAETSRLKATLSDRESTIVSQQEELWRLRPRVKELELELDCICDDCVEKYDKKIAERDELRNLKAALEKTNSQ